jgi:hypothetical protein
MDEYYWDMFCETGDARAYLRYKGFNGMRAEREARGKHIQGQGHRDKGKPGGRT